MMRPSGVERAGSSSIFARHFATGDDRGFATLGFADGHVKPYTARSIITQDGGANLVWRFR
jgi:prepilin-type processing-associated H-X9-DG protein